MTTEHLVASTQPAPYELPADDFLGLAADLDPHELDALVQLRRYLEEVVRPEVNDHWERAAFPSHLVPGLAELGVLAYGYEETTPFPHSARFRGFVTLELARVDAGLATFTGVTNGLTMGAIAEFGSAEQRARWLPPLGRGELIGAFALTEPTSGSDIARGLSTSARRRGDTWVLNGRKRWIGNATWADIVVTLARDEDDGQVKAYVVPTATAGYHAQKIEGKYSQRTVQNADITLVDVTVPDRDRLPGANSFKDVARILTITRLDVAWSAIGNAIGAYEAALAYACRREQFGRPIAGYQLVQDLLVRSVSAITAAVAICVHMADMLDRGALEDHHSAMAKAFATARAREVVAWCREILGGNGIQIDHDVIRHFNDAEAAYSFEGTREMNSLIVGRHITGMSAFV